MSASTLVCKDFEIFISIVGIKHSVTECKVRYKCITKQILVDEANSYMK
jgi:hypothetical protein